MMISCRRSALGTGAAVACGDEDALIAPLMDVFLHEAAHALFDLLAIPVLGREEDAADQVAAYYMLQYPKETKRRLIIGAAFSYAAELNVRGARGLVPLWECPLVVHNTLFELAFFAKRDIEPVEVQDTLQAVRLLRGPDATSLESAVATYFDLLLPKDLQTSDWSARSLTLEQISYAATDPVVTWHLARKILPILHERTLIDRVIPSRRGAAGLVPYPAAEDAGGLRLGLCRPARDDPLPSLRCLGSVDRVSGRPPSRVRIEFASALPL